MHYNKHFAKHGNFPTLHVSGCFQVCREFQRGTCTRQASECRFAHPTENVTVDSSDNHVTVCMDFIKNKCTRDSCRYFHPPAHLQSQIKAAQQRANSAATAQAPALVGPHSHSFSLFLSLFFSFCSFPIHSGLRVACTFLQSCFLVSIATLQLVFPCCCAFAA